MKIMTLLLSGALLVTGLAAHAALDAQYKPTPAVAADWCVSEPSHLPGLAELGPATEMPAGHTSSATGNADLPSKLHRCATILRLHVVAPGKHRVLTDQSPRTALATHRLAHVHMRATHGQLSASSQAAILHQEAQDEPFPQHHVANALSGAERLQAYW